MTLNDLALRNGCYYALLHWICYSIKLTTSNWLIWSATRAVASLGLVSPGAATDGVTLFIPWKKTTFLVITVCQLCRPYFFLINWRPFLLTTVTFIDFTRVWPPLCKFSHNFLHGGCYPWRSAPLVTLLDKSVIQRCHIHIVFGMLLLLTWDVRVQWRDRCESDVGSWKRFWCGDRRRWSVSTCRDSRRLVTLRPQASPSPSLTDFAGRSNVIAHVIVVDAGVVFWFVCSLSFGLPLNRITQKVMYVFYEASSKSAVLFICHWYQLLL